MRAKILMSGLLLSFFAVPAFAKVTTNFTESIVRLRTMIRVQEAKGVNFWLEKEIDLDCNSVTIGVKLVQHSEFGATIQTFTYDMNYLSTRMECENPPVKKLVATKKIFIPKRSDSKDIVDFGVDRPDGWKVKLEEVLEDKVPTPLETSERIYVPGIQENP